MQCLNNNSENHQNNQCHQNNDHKQQHKLLKLILGKDTVSKIKSLNILLVGVGGIGCQVLKNISKLPINKITLIDLDTIQVSNLNRQFYFHQQHINKPKSIIAAQQLSKLSYQNILINPIHGNIYQPQYSSYKFYSQFDYVISALDNIKAREYVARKCTQYGLVFIDAGTAGYHGQSYYSERFVTGCHNCYSATIGDDEDKQDIKDDVDNNSMAVCTIRSRPQRSIHCAVYAKYIYEQLFNTASMQTKSSLTQIQTSTSTIFTTIRTKLLELKQQQSQKKQQYQIRQLGIKLFNYLFCEQFQQQQQINSIKQSSILTITYQQTINNQQSPYNISILNLNTDQLWSIKTYTEQFIYSFINLYHQFISKQSTKHTIISNNNHDNNSININSHLDNDNQNYIKLIPYDKDNDDCNMFICCVTNLRVYNFLSKQSEQKIKINNNNKRTQTLQHNQQKQYDYQQYTTRANQYQRLKYISYQQCRKLIGKIIPAIASTNSIAASLQISQLIDLIVIKDKAKDNNNHNNDHNYNSPKYYTISPYSDNKLCYSWLSLPNPNCTACSPTNIYYFIKCNFSTTTFRELEQFTSINCYSFNRDVYCRNMIIIKNINAKKQSVNKYKMLNFKKELILEGELIIEYYPVKGVTDLKVKIVLIDREQQKQLSYEDKQDYQHKYRQKFTILNQPQLQSTLKALQLYTQKQQQHKITQQTIQQAVQTTTLTQIYQPID